MPLSSLQHEILRVLAAHRSPESYAAGSTPLHRDGPRFSGDIDIFHHREEQVAATAAKDAAILTEEGFAVEWLRQEPGIHAASIQRRGESTKLEWVRDSDFRFYPALADELFGYPIRSVPVHSMVGSSPVPRTSSSRRHGELRMGWSKKGALMSRRLVPLPARPDARAGGGRMGSADIECAPLPRRGPSVAHCMMVWLHCKVGCGRACGDPPAVGLRPGCYRTATALPPHCHHSATTMPPLCRRMPAAQMASSCQAMSLWMFHR